ncbi:hypothetical protein PF008_g8283 [Phytophthora fragariae]|uniref:Uncharacterized protein n=1 Tax=Phytophthora fragariae TaxID=53985 RepID=A0A6G0S040_9STRA|nr:hypothetical protein PF008_g8283 [Phytophthora fragariae]
MPDDVKPDDEKDCAMLEIRRTAGMTAKTAVGARTTQALLLTATTVGAAARVTTVMTAGAPRTTPMMMMMDGEGRRRRTRRAASTSSHSASSIDAVTRLRCEQSATSHERERLKADPVQAVADGASVDIDCEGRPRIGGSWIVWTRRLD